MKWNFFLEQFVDSIFCFESLVSLTVLTFLVGLLDLFA